MKTGRYLILGKLVPELCFFALSCLLQCWCKSSCFSLHSCSGSMLSTSIIISLWSMENSSLNLPQVSQKTMWKSTVLLTKDCLMLSTQHNNPKVEKSFIVSACNINMYVVTSHVYTHALNTLKVILSRMNLNSKNQSISDQLYWKSFTFPFYIYFQYFQIKLIWYDKFAICVGMYQQLQFHCYKLFKHSIHTRESCNTQWICR